MYKLQFVLLLATSFCFSQNTAIPDANFEQALIELGLDSGEIDGQVLTANINGVTSIDLDGFNISDLTGIEGFTALEYLRCEYNQLTSLDVSQNTALNYLECNNNGLTRLDVSQNTALEYLECNNNELTSLDVSQNTALQILVSYENQLTELIVSSNPALEILTCNSNSLTTLDLSSNPNLEILSIDNNQLETLDLRNGNNSIIYYFISTNNPNLSCIFVDNADYSSTNWTNIDPAATFVEDDAACSVLYTSIPDANFEQALIDLGYDSGEIDGQVLTANISDVTSLIVNNKNIESLTGIEDFTALTLLWCFNNQITSLDLSANTALNTLYCYTNQLTSLDLSANTALEYLTCFDNQLTSLDIRNGNNASIQTFWAYSNPDLSCIFVDDISYSTTNWTDIDPTATFVEDEVACSALYTSIPDANFEQALIDLGYDSGEIDGQVLTANINAITTLDIGYNSILDLTGIEAFSALEFFTCSNNQLESLDMSANKALIELLCSDNKLTSLNISANTALTKLWCYDNQLKALDITKNFKLNNLACYLNQLTVLDLSANTALTSLWCWGNELTSLNLTNNLDLDRLLCDSNKLESLDVSSNTILTRLYCESNQLTSLDLRLNKNLTSLGLANNQLETLDIRNGNNANITYFNSTGNLNLSCIFVDNPSGTNDSWQIDPDTFLVKDETACQALSLGDHAFESEFSVYPSPVKDKLFISGNETPMAVSIFNVLGKEVLSIKNTNNINVEALPSGVYMIRVSYDVSKTNRKFIKH